MSTDTTPTTEPSTPTAPAGGVKTAKVERREVVFGSLDEIVAEAERLVAAPSVKLLGNWTLGQLLDHIALGMDASIDGTKGRAPWYMRAMMWFLRGKMLKGLETGGVPAGFSMPKDLEQDFKPGPDVTAELGLDHLKRSVERLKTEEKRSPHVAFGEITREQHDLVHRRHAAMHLGFVVPVE